jgi:hypothetical protein
MNEEALAYWGLLSQKQTAFLQGLYNYTPETNHVSRLCRVAAVLDGTLNVISLVGYSVL